MSDSRFIKTVPFGGYDKTEVDSRLEAMYTQLFDLKNELREVKLINEEIKKGSDEEKAHETVLAGERSKLTAAQVQKETLSDKLKAADDEKKAKDKEIEDLRAQIEEYKKQIEENDSKLALLSAGNDASALGAVFIEAQKAADTVIRTSEAKARDIENNAKKLAENMVDDANNKAAQIIYDAEKRAAEMDAEASNTEAKAKVASGNMRTVLLGDIDDYMLQMAKLRESFEAIEKASLEKIKESEKLLQSAKGTLTAGGIPTFTEPALKTADLPPIPKLKPIDHTYPTPEEDKSKEETKKAAAAKKEESKAAEKPAKKGPSLADLAKKASSFDDDDE